jgi:hypothetical protein
VSMKVGGVQATAVFIGPVPPARDPLERIGDVADAPSQEREQLARIDHLNPMADNPSREENIVPNSRPTPKAFSLAIASRPQPAVNSLEAPPVETLSRPTPAPLLIGNLPAPPAPPPPSRPPVPPAARAPAAPRSGRLIWTGHLSKNGVLTIVGNHASSGALTGAIPGRPVRISLYPAKLTNDGLSVYSLSQKYPPGYTEPPGIHNGWNKASYFRDPRLAGALKALEEPNSNNGWKKLVLRNDGVNLSILLIEWSSP